MLEAAAATKARHSLSLAGAWSAASAALASPTLVHKDPEREAPACEQELLPYR